MTYITTYEVEQSYFVGQSLCYDFFSDEEPKYESADELLIDQIPEFDKTEDLDDLDAQMENVGARLDSDYKELRERLEEALSSEEDPDEIIDSIKDLYDEAVRYDPKGCYEEDLGGNYGISLDTGSWETDEKHVTMRKFGPYLDDREAICLLVEDSAGVTEDDGSLDGFPCMNADRIRIMDHDVAASSIDDRGFREAIIRAGVNYPDLQEDLARYYEFKTWEDALNSVQ